MERGGDRRRLRRGGMDRGRGEGIKEGIEGKKKEDKDRHNEAGIRIDRDEAVEG